MPLIRPFAGLRPAPDYAAEVAAPPYDVLSSAEARQRAAGKPFSFLHISRPEIDLPERADPHSPAVYAKAAENLQRMLREGVLVRDPAPACYVYRLIQDEQIQTGLVAAASIAAYDSNRIRRHEHTRPDKEDDRVRQIEALGAQTGPVLLAYPAAPAVDAMLLQASGAPPATDITADDGVRHTIWPVSDAPTIDALTAAFDAMPALYIADGHHRSAAASRVAVARCAAHAGAGAKPGCDGFLAVAFPHHQMRILGYNRLVRDLKGRSALELLMAISAAFEVERSRGPVQPARHGEFGMYLRGQWYRLRIQPALAQVGDPVRRLDVSLLADHLLRPVLHIADPRTDKRIDFVGGARGLDELERRVDSGEMAAAFSLYPTRMEDLMAVADSGQVMPPKSTWFEPKLADGLVSYLLD
ncbi:MAG TPA: DUF1015 family protein [Burkholderiales bacterium]|nr:DUF1015 family protein [Burkholderiales bacterium]